MTTRNLLIGSTILASLIGIGYLFHRLNKEDDSEKEDLPSPDEAPRSKVANLQQIMASAPVIKTTPKRSVAANPTPSVVEINPRLTRSSSRSRAAEVKRDPSSTGTSSRSRAAVQSRSIKPVGFPLNAPVELQKQEPSEPVVNRPKPIGRQAQVKTKIADDKFPLKKGSVGPKVERLNVWLTRNHSWTGKITDEFDDNTEYKLKRLTKRTEVDEPTYRRMRMDRPVFEQKIIR